MPKDELVCVGHMLDKAREAARRVSSRFRERHPKIPWETIAGMRSKIVHDYMNVDEDNVWDSVT